MSNVISTRLVKTRKGHWCSACGQESPRGSQMEQTTERYGGTLATFYWCQICVAFIGHLDPGDVEFGFDRDIWDYDEYRPFRVAAGGTLPDHGE
jgi:hypothetical protein